MYILKENYCGEQFRLDSRSKCFKEDVYEFVEENNKGKFVYFYTGSAGLREEKQ